jgi:hypothetical protein
VQAPPLLVSLRGCYSRLGTDNRKEDWWRKARSKTIRPRQNLVTELYYQAVVCFYLYQVNRFLEHARRCLQQHVGSRLTKCLPSASAPC